MNFISCYKKMQSFSITGMGTFEGNYVNSTFLLLVTFFITCPYAVYNFGIRCVAHLHHLYICDTDTPKL